MTFDIVEDRDFRIGLCTCERIELFEHRADAADLLKNAGIRAVGVCHDSAVVFFGAASALPPLEILDAVRAVREHGDRGKPVESP